MSEPMREYTEEIDLRPLAEKYPSARKVTVDMAGRAAYVFTGSGNRAITVTGAEFEALVKMLPPTVERDEKDGETPAGQKKRGKAAE